MANRESGGLNRVIGGQVMSHTNWDHFWVPLRQLFCVHLYVEKDILMLKLVRLYCTSRGVRLTGTM